MVQMGDPEMLWKRADSARDGKRVQKVPRGGLKVGGLPVRRLPQVGRDSQNSDRRDRAPSVWRPSDQCPGGIRDVSSHPVRRLPSASAGGSASSCACGRCLLALEQRKKQMRGKQWVKYWCWDVPWTWAERKLPWQRCCRNWWRKKKM